MDKETKFLETFTSKDSLQLTYIVLFTRSDHKLHFLITIVEDIYINRFMKTRLCRVV